jgi:hypothetical protein
MRYALLLSLLSWLSGCTLVPIADAGPCAAVTNARGCQEKPYIIKSESESTAQAGTAR